MYLLTFYLTDGPLPADEEQEGVQRCVGASPLGVLTIFWRILALDFAKYS